MHIPILVEPIVESLLIPFSRLPLESEPSWFVDCTLGGGGHTAAMLEGLKNLPVGGGRHRVLAIDQDPVAVENAKHRFAEEMDEGRLEVMHLSFGQVAPILKERPVLGLLADLGFSSNQLEDPERGLSFQRSGPLDMRLDPTRGRTCREFLQSITERELEAILSEYGEERFSKRIARAIYEKRRQGELPRTTTDLAELVYHAVPPSARHGRIHVATRTFQALRIAVNQELFELDSLLKHVILEVRPGGEDCHNKFSFARG